MKYTVVYSSKTGNTRSVAKAIYGALPMEGGKTFRTIQGCTNEVEADLVFVGGWIDKGRCNEEALEFIHGLKGKKVALFATLGAGNAPAYLEGIAERLKAEVPEGNEVKGIFLCLGKMQKSVRERYESMLKQNPGDKKIMGQLANWDFVMKHPDQKDFEDAATFAVQMAKEL